MSFTHVGTVHNIGGTITNAVIEGGSIGNKSPASGYFDSVDVDGKLTSSTIQASNINATNLTVTGGIDSTAIGTQTSAPGSFSDIEASSVTATSSIGVGGKVFLGSSSDADMKAQGIEIKVDGTLSTNALSATSGQFTNLTASSLTATNGQCTTLVADSISVTGSITGISSSATLDNITVGSVTPAPGTFTTVSASTTNSTVVQTSKLLPISGTASMDGCAIGSTTASNGNFTTLQTTRLNAGTASLSTVTAPRIIGAGSGSTIDGYVIGASNPKDANFSSLNAQTLNATTVNATSGVLATRGMILTTPQFQFGYNPGTYENGLSYLTGVSVSSKSTEALHEQLKVVLRYNDQIVLTQSPVDPTSGFSMFGLPILTSDTRTVEALSLQWDDGNPTAEDRSGLSVVITTDASGNPTGKVRKSIAGDTADKILGVAIARGAAAMVFGGVADDKKYQTDAYGNYVRAGQAYYVRQIQTDSGTRTEYNAAPTGAAGEQKVTINVPQANPNYNPAVDLTPHFDSPTWAMVGYSGIITAKLGQVVPAHWRLMSSTSTTNQYLVI